MKRCDRCNDTSPNDAVFCINCGKSFTANTGKTTRLNKSSYTTNHSTHYTDYIYKGTKPHKIQYDHKYFYMTRDELLELLKDQNVYEMPSGTIYYFGREVILTD